MQLTEEEFQNIMEYILHKHIILFPTQIINQAKKDGWITKTKLKEFQDIYEKIRTCEITDVEYINLYKLATAAISELQDEINKLKEKE
jgi:hypothetical protein